MQKFNSQFSLPKMSSLLVRLTKEQKDIVRGCGFGSILKLKCTSLPNPLVMYLAKHYDPKSNSVKLPDGGSFKCKTPDFHRKSASLYHRDSPWISGYRVQNVSQNNTQSHTSHHIKIIVHKFYYKSIMEYIITSLLAELE
jgi:hypothetical protein